MVYKHTARMIVFMPEQNAIFPLARLPAYTTGEQMSRYAAREDLQSRELVHFSASRRCCIAIVLAENMDRSPFRRRILQFYCMLPARASLATLNPGNTKR
jgi:hypothetical protein